MAGTLRRHGLLKVRRLARMSLDEVAVRGGQAARKWAERWGPPAPLGPSRLPEARDAGRGPSLVGPPRVEPKALVRSCPPGHAAQLVESAEALLRGRFDLLGYRDLSFGDPVDWHLDPLTGRRAPRIHWSRIDPLDPDAVGDGKVVWELNRHQWLVTLAQAYRVSGDDRFAGACARHLQDWMRENPPGIGINWASSLEVALRLIAWCWVVALLESAVDAGTRGAVLEGIGRHATHVSRYLSSYSSPNTHLTGEALGLVYAGTALPDHPLAARWRRLGGGLLLRESQRQVHPDGVHFEQAFCYQRYTVEILLHFLILERRLGGAFPPVTTAVQRMLDFLVVTRQPNGAMPRIGDEDGGWLLPLARRRPDDLRGVLAVAAALFARGDYAWAAGEPAPEVSWLLGPDGQRGFEALTPAPPSGGASRCFEKGGYAVMSSGWERDAHQLILDVGPLGCPVSGGHGHADLLAIQCSAFGEAYLVDPGTYVYTPRPRWRDHFRGARAHNTVTVDGREPASPTGPFSWSRRPVARLRRWVSTPLFDYADAEHEALGTPGAPLRWRRRVLFAKPRFWIVADDISGAGEHDVELRFQLAPLPVSHGPGAWVRAHGASGRGLGLRCFASTPLTVAEHRGEIDPIRGWVSPAYGCRVPAPVVVVRARGVLPCRFVTLLVPLADVRGALPEVSAVLRDGREVSGLHFAGSNERVLFDEDGVVFECAASSGSSR